MNSGWKQGQTGLYKLRSAVSLKSQATWEVCKALTRRRCSAAMAKLPSFEKGSFVIEETSNSKEVSCHFLLHPSGFAIQTSNKAWTDFCPRPLHMWIHFNCSIEYNSKNLCVLCSQVQGASCCSSYHTILATESGFRNQDSSFNLPMAICCKKAKTSNKCLEISNPDWWLRSLEVQIIPPTSKPSHILNYVASLWLLQRRETTLYY